MDTKEKRKSPRRPSVSKVGRRAPSRVRSQSLTVAPHAWGGSVPAEPQLGREDSCQWNPINKNGAAGKVDACLGEVLFAADEFTVDMHQNVATPQMVKSAVDFVSALMARLFTMLRELFLSLRQDDDRLYTREELAKRLGIGLTTLDTMRQDPGFPCIRLTDASNRGAVRFEIREVFNYLRRKDINRQKMAK